MANSCLEARLAQLYTMHELEKQNRKIQNQVTIIIALVFALTML